MRENCFILFSLVAMAGALGVVFSRQVVHSAFSLVISFIGLASLFILWGNSFIGILQIWIYTGAIVVLFVFVILLLNLSKLPVPFSFRGFSMTLILISAWFFALLMVRTFNRGNLFPRVGEAHATTHVRAVSSLLFGEYLWAFEILSVFLLALVVAVCVLMRPQVEGESG